MRRQSQFTRIELAVAAACAGVLAALALPALADDREDAIAANCLSNLKQCMLFELMFSSDNQHGVFITYAFGPKAKPWLNTDQTPGHDVQFTWFRVLCATGYLMDISLAICPDAQPEVRAKDDYPETIRNNTATNEGWQTLKNGVPVASFLNTENVIPQWRTYGAIRQAKDGRDIGGGPLTPAVTGVQYGTIGKESSFPVLADSALRVQDGPTFSFARFSPLRIQTEGLAYAAHDNRINIAFADGHAEAATGKRYLQYCIESFGAPPGEDDYAFLEPATRSPKNE